MKDYWVTPKQYVEYSATFNLCVALGMTEAQATEHCAYKYFGIPPAVVGGYNIKVDYTKERE